MTRSVKNGTPLACECGNHFWAPASRGLVVLVSPIDAAILEYKWSTSFTRANRNQTYSCAHRNKKRDENGRGTIRLHREITGAKPGQLVDHINMNPMDNRRENLRICTHQQNLLNRPPYRGKAVPLKGVQKVSGSNKFKAVIRFNNQIRQLGQFDTPEEAHEAYVRVARELHGEFFRAA